jgi:hypothetical protein
MELKVFHGNIGKNGIHRKWLFGAACKEIYFWIAIELLTN